MVLFSLQKVNKKGPPAVKMNSPSSASIAVNRRSLVPREYAEKKSRTKKVADEKDRSVPDSKAAGGKIKRSRTAHHETLHKQNHETEARNFNCYTIFLIHSMSVSS